VSLSRADVRLLIVVAGMIHHLPARLRAGHIAPRLLDLAGRIERQTEAPSRHDAGGVA
jgi:hypothetical protein